MKLQLLILLALFQLPGQDLPDDIMTDYGKLNRNYEELRYQDTVTLPSSWIFWREAKLKVRFDERPTIVIDNVRMLRSEYKGEILKADKWPKCYATQENQPQGPFYIEDVTFDGFTLRGKAGMEINYTCRVIAKRAK